ncbi:hypothetical protein HUG10_18350 (plasmid) [Halorarum halophilum]|uniref:Uncharacterized protein n=1 Tax=Halorarum halophilum TaxID=2743090 RepID=A0A7D5KA36_9EURY|nr:FxLYD domain-containing protein [Halobaculum halophilum]QLG29574.1 hypothetical protein HUG10_18350 [Halobaculum halophilum]
MTAPPERTTRRRLLGTLGVGTAAVLGGCAGVSDGPTYVDGTVDDAGGGSRNASEMAAAEAVAEREVNDAASHLEVLSLEEHEFVVESGYKGPTVQGAVTNTGDDPVEVVEVRVRVYDDTGAQLGRYVASTGDVAPGATWRFEVILLASAEDIADYDVAVLGVPD